jgi:tripartite-type tricarboxylate transporter receptor subunit TctC
MKAIRAAAVIGCMLTAFVPARAFAQVQDYPNRPVNFIVPFAAGGSTSLFARLIGQKLEERFGKPFVVENRPGGGGMVGALQVVRAAPDGYTIMTASSTILAISYTVRKHMPYDPRKDLTPISLLVRVPYVLVVNPDLPVHSVDDLVRLARSKPGKLSFASVGPGTIHHLNAELFKTIFGLDIVHVPYKGTAPALQDVMAGHVQFMFSDVPPAKGLIESGKVRALGVTTAQRVKALPNVPPLAEVGIPNYNTSSWQTIATTAGVPKPIVEKLAKEIGAAMAEPDVQELLSNEGAIPQISPPPDELRKFVDSEIVRWGQVVEKAGIAHSQ